jgi:Xaa-Pro aminopeptidase
MLEFEALTLVPFDLRLLQRALLNEHETNWIDTYHQRVLNTVGPLLDGDEREWLQRATRPLASLG